MDEYKEEYEAFKGRSGGGQSNAGSSLLANSGVIAHTGAITQCSSTDTTWFCWLSRLVGTLQYIFMILIVIFLIYYFVLPFLANKLGFSGSKKRGGYL